MSLCAIEGYNITKRINKLPILKHINFKIPVNSITLVEGRNGSGKSVTLKIIAGLITHAEGSLLINGKVSYSIDFFPENLNLSIKEYFNFLLKLYKSCQAKEQINQLIHDFKLGPFINLQLKHCSKGTKQKVNIIQCLIKNADIYILDEPFSGLDKEATEYLINYLNKLKTSATIVLTSHESNSYKRIITHILNIESGTFYQTNNKYNQQSSPNKLVVIKNNSNTNQIHTLTLHINDIYSDHDKTFIQTNQMYLNELLKHLIEQHCEIIEIKDVSL